MTNTLCAAIARRRYGFVFAPLGGDGSAAAAVPAADDGPREPRVANPCLEEPDARIGHVRIHGGRGRVTAWGYPTAPSLHDSRRV